MADDRSLMTLTRTRFALLLVPAVVFLAFHARTLDYGFVWSDVVEIVQEGLILPIGEAHRAFTEPMVQKDPITRKDTSKWAYYRPLQVVVVSALHAVAGKTPRVYRLTSLLSGALTASIFMALAWALIGRPGPALFAALVPGLHPAGLEVYVWIAGLSESLVDLFLVSSLGCAALWLRAARRSPALLAGALASFVLALSTKENAVVLPALLLALVAGDSLSRRDPQAATVRVFGFEVSVRGLALIAGLGICSLLYLGVWRPFAHESGSIGGFRAIGGSRLTHVLTALSTWPSSLLWLVVPWESTTSDVVAIVRSPADPRVWLGVALPLASLLAWIALARRGHLAAAFGLAWIWIAFLPAANLIPTLHARADRHVFFSTFGLGLLLAELAPLALARVRAPHVVAPLLACAMLGLLAQRSWVRAPFWRSTLTLFEHDVGRDPDYREGRSWLLQTLIDEGRYEEALEHIEVLLPLAPGVPGKASYYQGDVYGAYCKAQLALGRVENVHEFVRELTRERPKRAASKEVQRCLAAAQRRTRR